MGYDETSRLAVVLQRNGAEEVQQETGVGEVKERVDSTNVPE